MDIRFADAILIMGSNMAEGHPVAFRFVMEAKLAGAKVIHVDPRFTRTSALADIYAPLRAGTDIAFLGGLVNYVLNSERWQSDPFFTEYVVHYTNAATLINEKFKDTEDLDGIFSGLGAYGGDPLNGLRAQYDNTSWQYVRAPVDSQGLAAAPGPLAEGQSFAALVHSLRKPPPVRDETLQDPRTVFQILKRHYRRYTPEMVERVT